MLTDHAIHREMDNDLKFPLHNRIAGLALLKQRLGQFMVHMLPLGKVEITQRHYIFCILEYSLQVLRGGLYF